MLVSGSKDKQHCDWLFACNFPWQPIQSCAQFVLAIDRQEGSADHERWKEDPTTENLIWDWAVISSGMICFWIHSYSLILVIMVLVFLLEKSKNWITLICFSFSCFIWHCSWKNNSLQLTSASSFIWPESQGCLHSHQINGLPFLFSYCNQDNIVNIMDVVAPRSIEYYGRKVKGSTSDIEFYCTISIAFSILSFVCLLCGRNMKKYEGCGKLLLNYGIVAVKILIHNAILKLILYETAMGG